MALSGNLDSGYGAQASYHNIGYFSWDKNGSLNILVHSYLDENARLNNMQPIKSEQISFKNLLDNNTITLSDLYNKIKTVTQFSDMIDV